MKHFRLLTFVVAAGMPACLVYDSELLGQAQGGGVSTVGDGDGDGGTGGVVVADGGSGGGGTDTGGRSGGDGDGDTGGDPGDGDGDGDTGGEPFMGGANAGGSTGGDSSGGGSTGGAPITAGSCPAYTGNKVITQDDLIDDMRLAGNAILTNGNRKGDWLAVHGADMTTIPAVTDSAWPTFPMVPVSEMSEDYALHYQATKTGTNNEELWQRFGFLLKEGSPYDLTGYGGILFCARRDAPTPQSINLELTEGDQDPDNDVPHALSGSILPATWGYIEIPFPTAVESALPNAKSIWFVAPGNGIEYDIWIDNIYLYKDP